MRAGQSIAVAVIMLAVCALAAGCICPGPGTGVPTPPAGTPAPGATGSPAPRLAANLTGWGTDQSTYARNDTAAGWVNVTNVGGAPIEEIDFGLVIRTTIFFVPVEKTFSHNATGLGIRPGETKKVQFSMRIPSDYEGISTAGNYQLFVTASLAGNQVGSFEKDIRVV